MNTNASLLVNSGSGASQVVAIDSGKPIKIKIQPGSKYLLKNNDNNFAPENITLLRNGDDLCIILEGDSTPAVVIEDYYVSGNSEPLLGMAEDGQLYAYIVTDGSSFGEGYLFDNGVLAPAALGGMPLGDGAYLFEETDHDMGLLALWPWFLGAAAVAGIIGNAIYEHNKDNGHSDPAPLPAARVASVPTLEGALDQTGSITGPIAYGSYTDENHPVIYGTGYAGDTINIYDNGVFIGSTIVAADGSWSFTPETALNDGSHSITITQSNTDGSVSKPSDDLSFIVDTVAPLRPLFGDIIDNVGPVTGPIANGATTDDTRPEVTGTGEPGNTITIFINGNEAGKAIIDSNGHWTWTPETDLADGHYQLTITETDKAGNVSPVSPTFDFNVDTSSPAKPAIPEVMDNHGDITGPIHSGDVTDETKPTFNGGDAEPGEIIKVIDNGEVIGSTVVNDDGKWEWTPTDPLPEGPHSIEIIVVDPTTDKESEPSEPISFEIDITPPAKPAVPTITDDAGDRTGAITTGDTTDDTTPTFSGGGTAGDVIKIYDNDAVIGSVAIGEDGKWEWTPETELTNGEHTITITETDPAGNKSETSDAFEFTVDTTAPNPDLLAITGVLDDVGEITGNITDGSKTDDASPVISGTGTKGDTIVVYTEDKTGNHEIGRTTVDDDGKWKLEPTTPLLPGSNVLTAVEIDPAGNSTTSEAYTIILDMIKPDVPVIVDVIDNVGDIKGALQKGAVTDDNKPEIIGTSKADYIVRIYDGSTLLGSVKADSNGEWTFTPTTALSDGLHYINATATSSVGQTSDKTGDFNFEVDTKAPAAADNLKIIDDVGDYKGELKDGDTTDDATPTFTGKAEANSTVTIYNGTDNLGTAKVDANGDWSFTPSKALADGDYVFHTVVTDKAGNSSPATDDVHIRIDTTGVTVSITHLVDDVGTITGNITDGSKTDDASPVISGTGTKGDTIVVYTEDKTGNHEIGRTTVDDDGKWKLEPTTPLLPGSNVLTAVEIDLAGNSTTSEAYTIILDMIKPDVPVIVDVIDNVGDIKGALQKGDVTDDNKPEIIGTAKADYIVRIYDGSTLLGSVKADSNGEWTFTPTTALSDGLHYINATATSSVGQTSDKTGDFNFEVDTKAPAAADNLKIIDDVGDYKGELKDGDTTDDATPTFTGKAEANSTVTIYNGTDKLGTAKVDANGDWSFTPSKALADGDYVFHTVVTDKAGNSSPATDDVHIRIDTTGVKVSITHLVDDVGTITGDITPNGVTDDTKPEIIGEGKPGSVVKVYDNVNTLLGSTTVKADGSWSFTPATALSEGKHSITVTATDKANNTTPQTSAFVFTVDITKPSVPTIEKAVDDVGTIQGDLKSGDVTDDSTPTLSGKAESNSLVIVYDGTAALGSVVADSNGAWSFTPTTPIKEGEHKFHVTATDEAGNLSDPSADFVLITDYTPPPFDALAITGVDDQVGAVTGNVKSGETTDDNRPTISGTGTKGDTIYVYTTDSSGHHLIGSTTVDADGKWSLQPASPLLKGDNVLTAEERDLAGNEAGPSAPYTIKVDIAPPAPPVIERIEDNFNNVDDKVIALQKGAVTDDNTPTIIGTAVADGIVTIYNNDVAIGSVKVAKNGEWSFTPEPALEDGKYNIRADVVDTVGRTSEKTGIFDFEVDTTPPGKVTDLVVTDDVGDYQGPLKSGDVTDDGTPTFTGKAEANSTVTIYNGETKLGTATADASGKWEFTPSTSLANGDYTFTITVTDKAGNTGEAETFNLTIDKSAVTVEITKLLDDVGDITGPITPTTGVTDDTRPEIIGEGKASSIIKVYDGETLLGSTTVKADGTWTFTPSADLKEGSHSITATATDLAGNTSNKTSPFVFEIDTTKPSVPTIDSAIDDVGTVQGTLLNGNETDDPTPTLIGKAEKGSIVKVYDGDALLGSVTADSTTGAWSFTPESGLPEGKHTFHVTATDKAGNVSDKSADFVLTMDFTKPDMPAITGVDDQVGAVTGNVKSGDITDDNRPTISGTGTKGDLITVYTNDGKSNYVIGSVKVGDDGKWSLQPAAALANGKHEFTAVEMDPVGNTTEPSPSYTITVDTGRPDVPTIDSVMDDVGTITGELKDGDSTDDTKPTISGTATSAKGGTVTIYNDGVKIGTTTVDANGKWTFTPATALEDGTYKITVDATNKIGQTSDKSDAFNFTVDTKAPAAVTDLLITDNVGEYQGPLKDNDTTDDNTPTFSGKAEANSIVTIYDGTTPLGSVKAGSDGSWTFTPDALDDGKYEFSTKVTDAAGNTGDATAVVHITVETDVLTVEITKLEDNVGDITGPIEADGFTDDTQPEVIGITKANSIVKVYDGETLLGSTKADAKGDWSFTPATALKEGEHSITAKATDLAGNTSAATDAFKFTIDTVAPTKPTIESAEDNEGSITGTLHSGDFTDDSTPTLTGKAEKGSTVNVYDGTTLLGTTTANSEGVWTYTTDALTEAKHTFHVTSTDAAGNVSVKSDDFILTMDYTKPDLSKLAITGVDDQVGIIKGNVISGGTTDDTRPTISGTGTKDDIITVYTTDSTGKHVIGSTTVDADGKWKLQPATALAEGKNEFTAVETDLVGLSAGPSTPYIITLDTYVSDAKIAITAITDDTGGSSTDFITNDNTLLISGTLDKALQSDEAVEVSLDNGTTWTRAGTVTDSTWTVDLQSKVLADGDYTIKARVVDTAGNVGSTDSHALTIITEGRDMEGLSTTAKITTDTSNGLVAGDLFSHSATLTNTDMVTRDRNVTVTGTLSAALLTGEKLQISLDDGATWKTLTMTGNNWSYVLPEVSADTTYKFKLQVIDNAGNTGRNTTFDDVYKVVIDLTVPDALVAAPDIATHVSTKDSFTFDSSHYGAVEAGTIVALVSDENGNGNYQEGLDQVLAFATANADGSWSMTTKLPAGAHNLAFMVWDAAGNHSSMGASTSVGVTDGEGSLLITQKWGGTTDADGRGLNAAAVTISQDGLWSFFQSVRGTTGSTTANAGRVYTATDQENYTSTYLAQPSTSNGAGYNVDSNSYSRYINSAVFADINRDGYTDVMSQVSSYQNAGRTAYWMQNADGTFSPKAVDQGTLNHLGGVIAYDREGDGYLDFVLADSEADSISFLKNDKGVLSYEKVAGFDNGHPGGAIPAALSIMHEVGAVDIDNNGTVDITAHIDYNGVGNYVGNNSRGLGILYNQLANDGSGKTKFSSVGYYADVFANDGHEDYGNLSISMTYADFNGDGWLDLFLSRGTKAGANSDESRIYLNDGTGRLIAQDSQALWFGDKLAGGTSLAVDWNHDGKIDIIEIPRSGVNGSPTLYTNLGTDIWNGGGVSLTGSTKFDDITGAVALDYDWDGSMDIVLYRASSNDSAVVSSTNSAPTLLVKNTNIAADGTSLQIRIVDGFGINTFYSNTVKLFDSKGACVATQLINPQASGSSNSMGLVSFFGLDPNEVYSVQLLRITNGVSDNVGAAPIVGGRANGTVNVNWGGLTTSKSHDAYVLTAESSDANNNTVGTGGIIGTGYNDTFFGSGGDDTYTGGGGWNLIMSGQQVWSATAGLDIVDYSRSASAITANLMTGVATGWGTDKLVSIEGLIGSAQGDTFTDNAANNLFEGRGGNDTFYLTNGGNDVLMYKVLPGKSSDAAGGNGHDTVYGFTVGNLLTNNNADLIDLSDLLDYSGPLSCFMDEGVMTLDFASQGILKFLKVEQVGNDTIISIDRDGTGGAYGFQELITLKGVSTDLVTLLSNNQIEVGDDSLMHRVSGTQTLVSTTHESLMSISQMFTAGDDILFGTDKADILMGGLGNDTFIHIGTGDQVMGGAGNDVIKLASTDFAYISGDEGIDTLVLEGKNELLDLGALKDKLESIEIFDMGDGSNTMKVSLDDVLRLGSEELAIHSGHKAIVVNGEEGSTLKLESGDGQWTMSQSNYQHDGNTYNVWTMSASGIEVLVENTVNPIIM
ncbi:Ig-like domain repeat protein [Budviciaceae bacterium BWR-B9]|uniref:Ig-like domain repeat protein n=1 Tax=Limnobaculum allomyrinae TaxID=2791986 RepID=A0ABS1IPZ6_9GAMM|nr:MULTISPECIES: Ig-like domain-containing protein [Limnobaculum]MBK5143719.1 Ig-like domain repeat protein [Limnobaculum allomyrinae]MBV7693458.1 Ig-like domain repeat protein [Limnobaculum sp. M2-1]